MQRVSTRFLGQSLDSILRNEMYHARMQPKNGKNRLKTCRAWYSVVAGSHGRGCCPDPEIPIQVATKVPKSSRPRRPSQDLGSAWHSRDQRQGCCVLAHIHQHFISTSNQAVACAINSSLTARRMRAPNCPDDVCVHVSFGAGQLGIDPVEQVFLLRGNRLTEQKHVSCFDPALRVVCQGLRTVTW